jgi:hypothetical protein
MPAVVPPPIQRARLVVPGGEDEQVLRALHTGEIGTIPTIGLTRSL